MIKEVLKNMHNILDLLRWTSSKFNSSKIFYGHGTDNFWDESLHLILNSLHLPINVPTKIFQARLTSKERLNIIKKVIRRIKERIPVPYLTNTAWFCNLEFYVDRRVFIPRSPIGELIMCNFFNNFLKNKSTHILDMCTGSGCIAIAIANAYPNSEIDAVDISIDALKVAEHNIQLYNLEPRIIPIQSNLFHNLPAIKYDLIVSNPPYVKTTDIQILPKEFHYEPTISLSTNDDKGLEFISKILSKSIYFLKKNGILICEVGNTKSALIKKYPNVPFHWLNLINGGTGVFMLNYRELLFYNQNF